MKVVLDETIAYLVYTFVIFSFRGRFNEPWAKQRYTHRERSIKINLAVARLAKSLARPKLDVSFAEPKIGILV